jgi:hypothetical protein
MHACSSLALCCCSTDCLVIPYVQAFAHLQTWDKFTLRLQVKKYAYFTCSVGLRCENGHFTQKKDKYAHFLLLTCSTHHSELCYIWERKQASVSTVNKERPEQTSRQTNVRMESKVEYISKQSESG